MPEKRASIYSLNKLSVYISSPYFEACLSVRLQVSFSSRAYIHLHTRAGDKKLEWKQLNVYVIN